MNLEVDPYPKQAHFSVPQSMDKIIQVLENFNNSVPEKHAALKYQVEKPDSNHATFSRTAWGKEWRLNLTKSALQNTNVELTLVFTPDLLKELVGEFEKETPETAFLAPAAKEKRFLSYLEKASQDSLKINIEHFCEGIDVSPPSSNQELAL